LAGRKKDSVQPEMAAKRAVSKGIAAGWVDGEGLILKKASLSSALLLKKRNVPGAVMF
jgi:hypothetical protein